MVASSKPVLHVRADVSEVAFLPEPRDLAQLIAKLPSVFSGRVTRVSSGSAKTVYDDARIGNARLTATNPNQRSADAERYQQQLFEAVKSAAEVNQPRPVQDPSGRPVQAGHP